MRTVVQRPAQRQLADFAWDKFSNDRTMSRERHIYQDIRFILYTNQFLTMLWRLPSVWREVLTIRIESLNIDVFNGRTDVGEAPRDTLIVSHNDVRQAGQRNPRNVEVAAAEMSFVPQVRHLVPKMHVVRKQRLARNRVRSRHDPVV